MTICGFSIGSPDRALAWVDSEVFSGGKPCGHRSKLTVNALVGMVAIGTGYVELLSGARAAVQTASSFDAAVESLPAFLRCRSWSITGAEARSPSQASIWQAVVLIGPSRRFGRIVGAVFDSRDEFQPMIPVRSWRAPEIDEVALAAEDEHAVAAIALAQFGVLRGQVPRATPSALTIAEITPEGVNCRRPIDLATGKHWRSPSEGDGAPPGRAPVIVGQCTLETPTAGGRRASSSARPATSATRRKRPHYQGS